MEKNSFFVIVFRKKIVPTFLGIGIDECNSILSVLKSLLGTCVQWAMNEKIDKM